MAGPDCLAFALFGSLSGLVPLVGVVSGRCFAGNAALLGCCDVIIATGTPTSGWAARAMIEGRQPRHVPPEAIGPVSVQAPNGVIDVVVADEAEAVAVAKRYLSHFQGPVHEWDCADQGRLRDLIPGTAAGLRRAQVLATSPTPTRCSSCAAGTSGATMVTALVRIEGRPPRRGGQRPCPPRRRHRPRRRRQDRPLPPAL